MTDIKTDLHKILLARNQEWSERMQRENPGLFTELAKQVRANESGCLAYQLTKSRTEPNVYKVLELYASEDALKAHGATDYFKAAGAAMGPTMAGRPEIEYLDGVE